MAMTEAKKRNEGTMTLRVDRDLLTAFQNIAKDNNRTASQLVRDYMMNYVKKHGQEFIVAQEVKAAENTMITGMSPMLSNSLQFSSKQFSSNLAR